MHSPQTVRVRRTLSGRALIASLVIAGGLALLAPHIVASEEDLDDVYVVRQGDTLSSIAHEFGTTVDVLAELNGITNLDRVLAGTRLEVPGESKPATQAVSTTTYKVEAGDTLWSIAESFGVDRSALAELNDLDDEDHIVEGAELRIPLTLPAKPDEPEDRQHTVAAGETLSSIADEYGVNLAAILAANPGIDANIIGIGQVLRVPAFVLPELSAQTAQALRDASIEFDIDPYLLLALSLMESGWQSEVVSHAGAIGLMQLMPDTARWTVMHLTPAAINWHISVEDNARVGGAYLDHLLFIEGGDIEGALASYYQGWASYKINGMFEETRAYVDGILSLADRLRLSDLR